MVELLIGIAILGILSAVAAPNLSIWIQNAQIRTTADAIQNGLQLARAEAVRLNTTMRFQLMTSVDAACQFSTTSSNWVVSQLDPTAGCTNTPTNVAKVNNDPLIVQVRSSKDGSGNTSVTTNQSIVAFNGLGRQTTTTNLDASTTSNPPVGITINITNPVGGACLAAGPMKCLNVVVSTAGQIRMCDPSLSQATNPSGC